MGAAGVVLLAVGLVMMFTALRFGRVGLVAATISVQGAFAAIFAAIGGESLHPLSIVAIGVSARGTFVLMGGDGGATAPPHERRGILLALGGGLFHRLLAVLGLARRLGHRGRLGRGLRSHLLRGSRLPASRRHSPARAADRRRHPDADLGVGEVAAFGAYIAASDRIGVAVPAVIASQFALIAAAVGWFVLGERLGSRQIAGAGAILVGVTALIILQA